MSRRHRRHHPHHESPHELHLREIVDEFVPEGAEKPAYLAFAHEFARTLRHAPMPDFSRGTKLAVMRWFRRGLSGRTLWQVGSAVMDERFGPEAWREETDNHG